MGLHNVLFPFAAVPPIPARFCSFCTLSIICKGKWLFSLTSLRTRWEGSLAIEEQWLTLFISHPLTRIGWSIKAVFWHRWQVILHWLSGGEWYAASTTLALYTLALWLHFWSRLILDSHYRFPALFKAGKTAFLLSLYPHINTWDLILITWLNKLFKGFPGSEACNKMYWSQNKFI